VTASQHQIPVHNKLRWVSSLNLYVVSQLPLRQSARGRNYVSVFFQQTIKRSRCDGSLHSRRTQDGGYGHAVVVCGFRVSDRAGIVSGQCSGRQESLHQISVRRLPLLFRGDRYPARLRTSSLLLHAGWPVRARVPGSARLLGVPIGRCIAQYRLRRSGLWIVLAGALSFETAAASAEPPPPEGCRTASKIEYDSAKKNHLLTNRFGTYVRTGRVLRRHYWYCHL